MNEQVKEADYSWLRKLICIENKDLVDGWVKALLWQQIKKSKKEGENLVETASRVIHDHLLFLDYLESCCISRVREDGQNRIKSYD